MIQLCLQTELVLLLIIVISYHANNSQQNWGSMLICSLILWVLIITNFYFRLLYIDSTDDESKGYVSGVPDEKRYNIYNSNWYLNWTPSD